MATGATLLIWLTDTAQWWGDSARCVFAQSGHTARCFPSADSLLQGLAAETPAPDVIIYGCGSVSETAVDEIRRLVSRALPVVVAPGGADVATVCRIFALGATCVAERYGAPASLLRTVEAANQSSCKQRARRAIWSQPA